MLWKRIILPLICTWAGTSAAADEKLPVVVAFGDSLSAGYHLPPTDGFTAALQNELQRRGVSVNVVNASVNGDTSTNGLLRVNWMLRKNPDIVIVEFGANDMLLGQPPSLLYKNLSAIISTIQQSGAQVLLAGMLAAANLGDAYAAEFAAVYQRLSEENGVVLYPFFLRDVALQPELNLDDGLHPNADGVRIIAANIAPLVADMLTP